MSASDRVAVVTGGDSGIGAACAMALAQGGCDVAILYHSDQVAAHGVVSDIEALGRRALALQADVGDEGDIDAAFDAVRDRLGVAEVLVNSAGLNMSDTSVIDMELEQWERLLATDLTGSFLAARRFLRDHRAAERHGGAIVNITSIHAFAMRAGGADYAAAKGGQANLGSTLALEVAPLGITVNSIAPGMIMTDMNAQAQEDAEHRKRLERSIPLGRAGEADEVGRLAAFLASTDARYITGASITIDGGLSLLVGQGA